MRNLGDRLINFVTWLLLSGLALGLVIVTFPLLYLALVIVLKTLNFYLPVTIPIPGACTSQTFGKVSTAEGLDFEFVDTICHLLTVDETITISISRESGLPSWFNKTEIFVYDGVPERTPTITMVDRHTVRISVEAVSSIVSAKDRWEDITILHNIGHVSFPDRNDPPRR